MPSTGQSPKHRVDSNFYRSYSWLIVGAMNSKHHHCLLLLGLLGILAILLVAPIDAPELAFDETSAPVALAHPALPRLRLHIPSLDRASVPAPAVQQPAQIVKPASVQSRPHGSPDFQPLLCTFLI
jgi:hypothetical protein